MIIIKNVEELEAKRERQFKEWIDEGKEEDDFYLNLEEADLTGSDFTGANLSRADLSWANLSGANLTKADMRGAIFYFHQIVNSKIKNTIITQSEYDYLLRMYSHEFMAGFIVKELE